MDAHSCFSDPEIRRPAAAVRAGQRQGLPRFRGTPIVPVPCSLTCRGTRSRVSIVVIRAATMADVGSMHRLITYHAEHGRMLFRSHGELYEHIRDFLVADADGQVAGCCALELVWRDLAEIKSLAVDETRRGAGIGRQLVTAALAEGRRLKLQRVFALTREQGFFEQLGFAVTPMASLPHKVWTDCVKCPVQDKCDEVAVAIDFEAIPAPPV